MRNEFHGVLKNSATIVESSCSYQLPCRVKTRSVKISCKVLWKHFAIALKNFRASFIWLYSLLITFKFEKCQKLSLGNMNTGDIFYELKQHCRLRRNMAAIWVVAAWMFLHSNTILKTDMITFCFFNIFLFRSLFRTQSNIYHGAFL